ncbi:hypothetical protein LCGC14_0278280 [marine sediment metagenome]|uniref:HNH nuclease domain-containing protein n=1 Tax=marine sediment metagenome TaxID=412755 RepID=A0A0F9TWU5_9ZZZZ
MPVILRPIKERFFEKINKNPITGCWNWTAHKSKSGYGYISVTGDRVRRAHRVSYELFVGPIKPGLFICHKCDNRGCVNPDHLFMGTHLDNMADMVKKGRVKLSVNTQFKPGHIRNRVLSDDIVRKIRRELAKEELTSVKISKIFGIGVDTVRDIKAGRSYSEIT